MLNTISGKTVLVIEDEEHNYLLIKEFLDLYEINTHWVESGVEGLQLLQDNKDFAFVMLDMKLPIISGYEVAPKIKLLCPDMIIIAQTAHAQPEDEQRCYNCGCDGYIAKPFTLDEMETVIIDTLDKAACVN